MPEAPTLERLESWERQRPRARSIRQRSGSGRSGSCERVGWELSPPFVHVVGYDITEPVSSVALGPLRFEAVKPEVLLADRMIGFKHWLTTTALEQQAHVGA